jgi:hypothetical protein
MSLAYTRRRKSNKNNRRLPKRVQRYWGGATNIVGTDPVTGKLLPGQEGSLSGILPTTTWGSWANYPGALVWSQNTQIPPPLANGGLYTGPQSTGDWASKPFPATQYGEMAEATKVAGNPEVFFQQRPNDNMGASFSPYVSVPLSNEHYSAMMPAPFNGGARNRKNRKTRKTRRNNSKGKKLSRRHK